MSRREWCVGMLGDMGGHLIGVVVERAHALYLERELQSKYVMLWGCECIFVTFYSISLSLSQLVAFHVNI